MPFVTAESVDLRSSDSLAAQGHLGYGTLTAQDHGAFGLSLIGRPAALQLARGRDSGWLHHESRTAGADSASGRDDDDSEGRSALRRPESRLER
jgi:hypothetical protein